jgi:hypothetical protein
MLIFLEFLPLKLPHNTEEIKQNQIKDNTNDNFYYPIISHAIKPSYVNDYFRKMTTYNDRPEQLNNDNFFKVLRVVFTLRFDENTNGNKHYQKVLPRTSK